MRILRMRSPRRRRCSPDAKSVAVGDSGSLHKTVKQHCCSCIEALLLDRLQPVCDPLKFHAYRGVEQLGKGKWKFKCFGPATGSNLGSVSSWKGHVTNGILFRAPNPA